MKTQLFTLIHNNNYDIVHGHYSYSAIIASLANNGKTVCSLMVGDLDLQNWFLKFMAIFYSKYIWDKTIVKSELMKKTVRSSIVIPNGVNFDIFKPIEKSINGEN